MTAISKKQAKRQVSDILRNAREGNERYIYKHYANDVRYLLWHRIEKDINKVVNSIAMRELGQCDWLKDKDGE